MVDHSGIGLLQVCYDALNSNWTKSKLTDCRM